MTLTFQLKEPIGGLGNQFFQMAGLLSICKDLSANYALPTHITSAWGTMSSPVYWNSIFRNVTEKSVSYENHTHFYDMVSTGEQFTLRDFSMHKDSDDKVVIQGILMNKDYFIHNRSYIQTFFKPDSNESYVLNDDMYTNVCVGIRRFIWENSEQYAYSDEYFTAALDRFLLEYSKQVNQKPLRFALFTDDSNWTTDFIVSYLEKRNLNYEYLVFQGARDGSTEIKHFYEMFFCKHFILSLSTFHYWAAILSGSHDSIIIYSGQSEWQKKILLPEWIQAD